MQSNGNKKKRDTTVKLSPEAYITARVLASMNGKSLKTFLSETLENWLLSKKREALTKIVETLQTNNSNNEQTSDVEEVSDADSGKSKE